MAEQLREVIFDTETTGLSVSDGDRIIEIGAIELINRFPSGNTFHFYLNPEGREVHPDALAIHGISNEFLADKKTFPEILDEFGAFFDDGFLVAHNAAFDIGFFNAELERVGKASIKPERVIDTLQIARRKFPGQRNSLDALCTRFRIDNSHREKHGALLDSELLAEVYLELTGSKQTSLVLEHAPPQVGLAEKRNEQTSGRPVQRTKMLPPRLSDSDLHQHKEFIATLEGKPIWSEYLNEKE